MKNKYTQSITDAFPQSIKSSKRKPNLLKTDECRENVNKFFNEFLNNQNVKKYSRYTDKGAFFAERFKRTIRELLKKQVLLKGNADWLSKFPIVFNQNNETIHHSIKKSPIQAFKKSK